MKYLIAILLLILLLAGSGCGAADSTSTPDSVLHFSGEVVKGEDFEYQLTDELVFSLNYIPLSVGQGWSIGVSNANGDVVYEDYAGPVTPPYRGPNALQIYCWQFDERQDITDIVPWTDRIFYFVLNEEDRKTANETLEIMLWPEGKTEEEINANQEEATEIYRTIPVGNGTLKITEYEQGEPDSNGCAQLERLAFDVEIDLTPGPNFMGE